MNVLCIGSRLDRTFAHTIARFALLDVPLVVVDLYDLLASGAISFNLERRTTTIEVANLSIDFADYSGVYSRAFDVSDGAPTDALRDRTRNAFHTLAFALRNDVAPRIVGRSGELSNLSKVFHLSLVRDLLAGFGILVPRSIVTNAGDELRAFIGDRSRFIVKGASAFKSSADEFGNEHLSRLQEHLPVPALVQQLISGPDVRVHIVNKDCFSEVVSSPEVDYRFAKRKRQTTCRVPDFIEEACRALVQRMNTSFLGIDFKVEARTGKWYFLEANSMPAYHGYDKRCEFAISNALGRFLSQGEALYLPEK
jgi:hypothetical protein